MKATILLTGGSGMVGRNLLDYASARGIPIRAPTRRELDLLNFNAIVAFLRSAQPDLIVHAAGRVGGIQANIAEPSRFLVENWDIGRNVVMAARQVGVRRLINLGSSCMYPRDRGRPLREDEIFSGNLEPTNAGYALAKISIAKLCEYVGREAPNLRYKTLVPSNIYGPYDTFDTARAHLVPATIRKLHEALRNGLNSVDIWGDGTARREFMFAGDLADAIVQAIDRFDSLPDLMNVGTGLDLSIDDYYRIAARVIGYTGAYVHDLSKPVGMHRKVVDTSLARQWGWQARVGLEEGIRRTYGYFLSLHPVSATGG